MSSSLPFFGRRTQRIDAFRSLSANERALLGLIRREAPLSRSELARRTGLALPTVSRLADQLLRDGLIVAEDKVMMSRMGQPSLPLSLADHAAYAFGAAVRADSLTVSLTHLSGRVVASIDEPHAGMTREQTVARIGAAIAGLIANSDVPPDRVCGFGLALPGFFVEAPSRINAPLGMDDWATADLERDLGDVLGLPALVENDGSAAALGEHLYGHGQPYPSLAYLYIDRGLGGGLVVDGKLMRGRRGNAGEFTGLLPAAARGDRPTLTLLRDMMASDGANYESLSRMIREIDVEAPAVARWIDRVTPATDAIISAIAAVADPDAIIIGGRLPKAIADRLAAALSYYTVPVRGRDRTFPTVATTGVIGDAAALGASALCFNAIFV